MVPRLSRLETLSSAKMLAVILLLLGYAALMLNAARRLSPTWDEIVYPAAGIVQWHTGSFELNREHPCLSKLILALPLLALKPTIPWTDRSWDQKDEFRFGYQFMFHNRIPATRLIFWSRVPAVLFSVLTGWILFLWVRSIWGHSGAFLSLLGYSAIPILSSRASLALLEAPMYFFILLSLAWYGRWLIENKFRFLLGSGVACGLALHCKLAALPLLATYAVFHLQRLRDHRYVIQEIRNFLALLAAVSFTFWLGLLPWKGGWDAAKTLVSNMKHFNTYLPFYWHGQTFMQAPALLSWAAFFVKAPVLILLLAGFGAWRWWVSGRAHQILSVLLIFAGICFSMALFFRGAVATIHESPLYLALAILMGSLGTYFTFPVNLSKSLGVICLLALACWDGWRVHPNYLSYFNPLAGGSSAGYRWLADSDQDWGQSLSLLAEYIHDHGDPNVLLAYSGPADPHAYGIRFQDLFSPALYSRETQGEPIGSDPRPVWVAMSTKVLQSEPRNTAWLRDHVPPKAMVGSCFFIYDVTSVPEAYRWIGTLYAVSRRPTLARWAFRRAHALEPHNDFDERALRLLGQ